MLVLMFLDYNDLSNSAVDSCELSAIQTKYHYHLQCSMVQIDLRFPLLFTDSGLDYCLFASQEAKEYYYTFGCPSDSRRSCRVADRSRFRVGPALSSNRAGAGCRCRPDCGGHRRRATRNY